MLPMTWSCLHEVAQCSLSLTDRVLCTIGVQNRRTFVIVSQRMRLKTGTVVGIIPLFGSLS